MFLNRKKTLNARRCKCGGATELYYPPGRAKGMAAVLFLTGAVFLTVGVFLGYQFRTGGSPDTMLFAMAALFFTLGVLLAAGGIHTLLNSLQVRIDQAGISTVRKVLGVTLLARRADYQQLKDIYFARGAQSGKTAYYSIFIRAADGRRIKIGESFVGVSNAEKMADQIKQWCEEYYG
ncbi:MAG: hypothetical protein L0Z73_16255 [Gammaproteobacteria bacterium]|nr:hypothetical protein [Gammaproteobacteria bacterium]